MIQDWKQEIAIAWLVKEALMQADKQRIWPYHLPEVAANEDEIGRAEQALGFALDPSYRAFLKHANGWHGFWHTADLFGTGDLVEGSRKENAEFLLSMLDEGVLKKSETRREELLPISATSVDRDLFVMAKPNSRLKGCVIWFAGEEVERFPTFDHYFLGMINYNRLSLQRLKES
jgi:hypothetical protein